MENDLVMMPIEQVKIAKDLDRNIENKKTFMETDDYSILSELFS